MGEEEADTHNAAPPATTNNSNGGHSEGSESALAPATGKTSQATAKQAKSKSSKQQSDSKSKSKQQGDDGGGGLAVDLKAIEEIKNGKILSSGNAEGSQKPQPGSAAAASPPQPPTADSTKPTAPVQMADDTRPRTKRNTVGWKSGRLWNIYPEGDRYGSIIITLDE